MPTKPSEPKTVKKPRRWWLFSKYAEEGYVPNRELFAYAASLTGQNMAYAIVSQWLFYFCTDVLHIGAQKVGFLTGFTRIWDGVNDSVVGTLIDRRTSKPGR